MALSPVHPLALPDSSADLRLPKKQRRRDEDPPDHSDSLIGEPVASMECDFQSNVKVPVSYKDIVTGSGGSHSESENIDLDDDDIDLLEEDITLGSMNGIPTIDFSERVQALAVRSMELTLDICPNLKISDDVAPMHSGAPPPAPVPGPSVPDEDFGPWMIVEKRKRNSRLPPQVNRVNHVNHTNPIFEEINPAQASTLDSREIAQISASPAIVQSAVNEDPLITDSVSTLSPLQTVKAT
ncbi:hypothetical protein V6N13_118144 [Hibiscus sabdariffa]